MHSGDQEISPYSSPILDAPWQPPGYLMIIGGADRLDPRAHIARLFLKLVERAADQSGQRDVVLISTATRHPEVLTDDYIRIFTRLGIPRERIHAPLIRDRAEANRPDIVAMLDSAAGIYMTGGDQYLLATVFDGSDSEGAIMRAYGRGAIVAGTSAGATAMGRPMVVAGGGTGEMRLGVVQMARGLAWAGEDLIIDTHFGARGRFPRLSAAVAEHPETLGIGIDENTCLLVDGDGRGLVEGTGVVYFVDASRTEINGAQRSLHGHPFSVGPLHVNVLSAGSRYSLRERRVLLESGTGVGYNSGS
jgi:cyanophycinase